MSQQNVVLVRRTFERFARDGAAALDEILVEFCDPDVEVRSVGRLPDRPGSARGREAVKALFTSIFETLETRLEADEYIDAGESVVVVFRQTSRGRASGAELTSRFAFVWRVRNGKILHMEGYRAKEEALEAAGLRAETAPEPESEAEQTEAVRKSYEAELRYTDVFRRRWLS